MVRVAHALVITVLLFLSLAPLQTISYTRAWPGSITIRDALNRTIVLEGPPRRVASLSPAITETIFMLGAQDRLVAADSYSMSTGFMNISGYCRSHGVVDVGGYWNVSVEKILGAEPDVVFADAGAHRGLLRVFEDNNLTVIYFHGGAARSVDDVYGDIRLAAEALGVGDDRAAAVIGDIERMIDEAHSVVERTGLRGKRVVVVIDASNAIWVAGRGTFIDDVLDRIGLVNAVGEKGWVSMNPEQLAAASPDIYVLLKPVSPRDLEEKGVDLSGVVVAEANETLTDELSRPGPRIGYGALGLAQLLAAAQGGGGEQGGAEPGFTLYALLVSLIIAAALLYAFLARRVASEG